MQLDEDQKREIVKIIEDRLENFISQHSIPPDLVKERHMGEGIRFLRAGLVANKPTTPEKDGATYYATDEDKLYIGDGGSWLSATFS